MDQALAQLLMVIYGVSIPSIAGLVAYWLTLRHRRRVSMESARQIAELRHSIEELQERLDFTERMLTQQRGPAQFESRHPTPV